MMVLGGHRLHFSTAKLRIKKRLVTEMLMNQIVFLESLYCAYSVFVSQLPINIRKYCFFYQQYNHNIFYKKLFFTLINLE
ncbi:hypothetical protein XELAEV_18042128mg [Xenopus laevis]|uniref:Uncharacterized protein n=1 Tax=Xenopus laevis TaxID=8355 RepID=A0A974C383_XENLA|nr:hypothetical protein XELAEV_18042128mg [Xenopus laevis]